MTNLLSLSFWFGLQPPPLHYWSVRLFLVFFCACICIGIVAKTYGVRRALDRFVRRAIERTGDLFLIMGVFGLLLFFFSYEQVPVLSMRLFYLVWLAVFVIWARGIYRYVRVEIPEKYARQARRTEMEKWLPKRKSK